MKKHLALAEQRQKCIVVENDASLQPSTLLTTLTFNYESNNITT